MTPTLWTLVSLGFLFRAFTGNAIEVSANSGCSSICDDQANGNVSDVFASGTYTRDLVCEDWQLVAPNSTAIGRKWKDCLARVQVHISITGTVRVTLDGSYVCEIRYHKPVEHADNTAVNMKYTLDWCVFGYPQKPNQTLAQSSCGETCSGTNNDMEASLTDELLNHTITQQTPFLYCDIYSGAFTKNAVVCIQCLEEVPGSTALVNCKYILLFTS